MLRAKSSTQLQTEVATLTQYTTIYYYIVMRVLDFFSYTCEFRHPNVVPLMGYCVQPPALVMPFMEGGSLLKRLHK